MIGFEIQINDQQPIVAASDRRMGILISCNGRGQDGINVFGTNSYFQDIFWYSKALKLGDRIKIRVVKVDEISPTLQSAKDMDRNEMLRLYNRLKTELQERRLIWLKDSL